MHPVRSTLFTVTAAVVLVVAAHIVLEAVDVRTAHDKTFDFTAPKTWGWNQAGAGEVKMARTKDDDAEGMKKRVEPLIRQAMAAEMTKRGLKEVTENPDLTVTYYLLLTVNVETQQFGQFVPSAVIWDLPVFPPATQSFKVLNRGSLVLDMAARNARDGIVWRGVAEAQVEPDASSQKRESKLKDAVRDLIRKYPPR